MSECVVWTLITARTLRLGPQIQYNLFYKGKCVSMWEGVKCEISKVELDGMDGISV